MSSYCRAPTDVAVSGQLQFPAEYDRNGVVTIRMWRAPKGKKNTLLYDRQSNSFWFPHIGKEDCDQ